MPSAWFFGVPGLVMTLGLAFAPVVTGLTLVGLAGVDPDLEEAARMVAGPFRVVTRILLPLAWPAVAFSALVVFALALSEVGVPMFLRVRTYSAAVFSRLGGIRYAPGEAVVLVLPLLAVAGVLLVLERWAIGRRSFASLGLRSGGEESFALGAWRVPVGLGVWGVCILSVAPLVGLGLAAYPSGFRSAWSWLGASVETGVSVAFGAATVITVLGLVLGHRLARRGAPLADGAAMWAFVTPAAVLGVGLVETWNRPGLQRVYTSAAILVLGLAARYGVVGVRTVAAVAARTSVAYEEAAEAFGAGYLRRLVRVFVPMHARGIVAAWVLAAVFCLRDLETVVIFYPPGLETLPVRIFTLEANGPGPVVAALALVHVGVTAGLLVVGWLGLGGRSKA